MCYSIYSDRLCLTDGIDSLKKIIERHIEFSKEQEEFWPITHITFSAGADAYELELAPDQLAKIQAKTRSDITSYLNEIDDFYNRDWDYQEEI